MIVRGREEGGDLPRGGVGEGGGGEGGSPLLHHYPPSSPSHDTPSQLAAAGGYGASSSPLTPSKLGFEIYASPSEAHAGRVKERVCDDCYVMMGDGEAH